MGRSIQGAYRRFVHAWPVVVDSQFGEMPPLVADAVGQGESEVLSAGKRFRGVLPQVEEDLLGAVAIAGNSDRFPGQDYFHGYALRIEERLAIEQQQFADQV